MEELTEKMGSVNHSEKGNCKRKDYIEWSDYFMSVAALAAMRSKDPVTQVGACIVNEHNKIVGIGYNGMPNGCHDDIFPWAKGRKEPLENKGLFVCHAEMNAIMNKIAADVTGCKIYVVLFPCNECAKLIIQSGIKEVIFLSDKHKDKPSTKASKMMMEAAGVKMSKFEPKAKPIMINLKDIENDL